MRLRLSLFLASVASSSAFTPFAITNNNNNNTPYPSTSAASSTSLWMVKDFNSMSIQDLKSHVNQMGYDDKTHDRAALIMIAKGYPNAVRARPFTGNNNQGYGKMMDMPMYESSMQNYMQPFNQRSRSGGRGVRVIDEEEEYYQDQDQDQDPYYQDGPSSSALVPTRRAQNNTRKSKEWKYTNMRNNQYGQQGPMSSGPQQITDRMGDYKQQPSNNRRGPRGRSSKSHKNLEKLSSEELKKEVWEMGYDPKGHDTASLLMICVSIEVYSSSNCSFHLLTLHHFFIFFQKGYPEAVRARPIDGDGYFQEDQYYDYEPEERFYDNRAQAERVQRQQRVDRATGASTSSRSSQYNSPQGRNYSNTNRRSGGGYDPYNQQRYNNDTGKAVYKNYSNDGQRQINDPNSSYTSPYGVGGGKYVGSAISQGGWQQQEPVRVNRRSSNGGPYARNQEYIPPRDRDNTGGNRRQPPPEQSPPPGFGGQARPPQNNRYEKPFTRDQLQGYDRPNTPPRQAQVPQNVNTGPPPIGARRGAVAPPPAPQHNQGQMQDPYQQYPPQQPPPPPPPQQQASSTPPQMQQNPYNTGPPLVTPPPPSSSSQEAPPSKPLVTPPPPSQEQHASSKDFPLVTPPPSSSSNNFGPPPFPIHNADNSETTEPKEEESTPEEEANVEKELNEMKNKITPPPPVPMKKVDAGKEELAEFQDTLTDLDMLDIDSIDELYNLFDEVDDYDVEEFKQVVLDRYVIEADIHAERLAVMQAVAYYMTTARKAKLDDVLSHKESILSSVKYGSIYWY